ncbi:uncharacterized protein LOC132334462 [Haemorhous mexicanus]|uniref:uncharacterized protein LOC132334462 n=1 Tax=Haemorhous mexicanus TaxID=30427 RepID=UPI0028BE86E6|nr:uncharacterized protein LOC132334462 [Haemorhous mexicanus]
MHHPSAEDQVSAGNTASGQQPGTQTPPPSASLEPAELERGARHACRKWVEDMWAQSMAAHGRGDRRCQGGDNRALASAGQGLLEEPFQSKASQPQPRPGCGSVSGSLQGPCTGPALLPALAPGATRARSALLQAGSRCQPCPSPEVQWALARGQRQRLRAQHCRQLQRELGASTEHRGEWDTECWQREVTTLGLSLEAALREREAAEWDLEALLHNHHQEMQSCRQHLLQVLRDQQRLAEEQRAVLERRYRALLQEALRDAAELAEHNQRLRDTRRAGTADATSQTP